MRIGYSELRQIGALCEAERHLQAAGDAVADVAFNTLAAPEVRMAATKLWEDLHNYQFEQLASVAQLIAETERVPE